MIVIPLIGGVITAVRIRKTWQETHEKNRIKKEIIDEYKNTLPKSYYAIHELQYTITEEYSRTQIMESTDGSDSKRELQFPTDEKELPNVKFSQEYKEFFKEYWKINYDNNKFITTLKLYYDDQNIVDEFNEIRQRLANSYLLIKELIETKTVQDFKKYFELIDKKLDEISPQLAKFEHYIIMEKIIIR